MAFLPEQIRPTSRVTAKNADTGSNRDVEISASVGPGLLACAKWAPIMALPALAGIAFGATDQTLSGIGLLFGLVIVAALINALAVRYIDAGRLLVRDGRLTLSNPLHRRTANPTCAIVEIVRVQFEYSRFSGLGSTVLLFIDATGRGALRIYPEFWQASDIDRVRAALGAPLNVRTGPLSCARLRHEYPGALPWWLAHLTLTTVIAILVITIAVEAV